MDTISIIELGNRTREAQIAMGIRQDTAWYNHLSAVEPIVKRHLELGKTEFDYGIVEAFMNEQKRKMEGGVIKHRTYERYVRNVNRLTEMHEKGILKTSLHGKTSKFVLNEYYELIIGDFLNEKDWNKNTRDDVKWVAKKFFFWLIQGGFETLAGVGGKEIQGFVVYCSDTMRISGVHNVKLYMKHLCDYLHRHELLPGNFCGLLSFRVNRETRVLPATPWPEIEAVLGIIDRSRIKGKRDYAMILLASVTGLRAVDIVRMKLTDIDWQRGEIKIVQSKTGEPVALPLTRDVGMALKDYILNGRHECDDDAVFLREKLPYRGFADAVAIGDLYDDYRRKAGLDREAFDGKGFHSLRRTVGTGLITADIPITTAAQILGDRDVRSMRKYIALDEKHLGECALDFSGMDGGGV